MQARMLALAAQASLAFFAWWMTRTDDERRQMQAGLWRELEKWAMKFALESSNLAAYAERQYKRSVAV
jgi:hypothetical protein